MGVTSLGEALQNGLKGEPALFGLAEPGGTEGLDLRKVVCGEHTGCEGRAVEQEFATGGEIPFPGRHEAGRFLEGAEGGAGLGSDDTIQ